MKKKRRTKISGTLVKLRRSRLVSLVEVEVVSVLKNNERQQGLALGASHQMSQKQFNHQSFPLLLSLSHDCVLQEKQPQ